ncbi:MAG TPA: DUF5009 domain-containing protein [Fimbriimonadaceae bacterium]|nr:DUF5009 domain-containing protein [Fimbriimonadaceae bacterium]
MHTQWPRVGSPDPVDPLTRSFVATRPALRTWPPSVAPDPLPEPSPQAQPAAPKRRVSSLDALRGFDMLWIIGGDEIAKAVAKIWPNSVVKAVCLQFSEHAAWVGLRFYDVIFPLFLFIMGAALPFSIGRSLQSGAPRAAVIRKILVRAAILFALGLIYNGALQAPDWGHVRVFGVLQRLALGYAVAAILFVMIDTRRLVVTAAAILVGYWALMGAVPAPGGLAPNYTQVGNLANYVDRLMLRPGQMYELYGDPEGLISTLPAVASALLGLFAGLWLSSDRSERLKTLGLILGGLALIALGLVWAPYFPIIKKIWSSSFVLVTGGMSAMLFGVTHWLVDVKGYRKLALPLIVIGANAILIYLLTAVVDFSSVAGFFLGGFANRLPHYKELILACGALLAEWLLLYFLYRKQVFVRV